MTGFSRSSRDPAVAGGKASIRGMPVAVGMRFSNLGAGASADDLLSASSYLGREDELEAVRHAARLAREREIDLVPAVGSFRMSGKKTGESAGGSDIFSYEGLERPEWSFPEDACLHIEEIERHVEEHYGPVASVLHELISDKVHLDVLVVPPGGSRKFWTFVTSGMSDRAMTLDPELADHDGLSHAELAIALPEAGWSEAWRSIPVGDDQDYPITWLKWLARFPHRYGTWLGYGHTITAGNPPEPIGPDTSMCGFILGHAITRDRSFDRLTTADGTSINFLAVYPLYESEMTYKLDKGADALFERMNAHGVTEIFDPRRARVA